MCRRWTHGDGERSGFECFYADMGAKPSREHSLDRLDPDGPYSPQNCRWATPEQQSRNRRCVRLNPDKVRTIRASNQPDKVLAKRYGVVTGAIWNARNGVSWCGVRP